MCSRDRRSFLASIHSQLQPAPNCRGSIVAATKRSGCTVHGGNRASKEKEIARHRRLPSISSLQSSDARLLLARLERDQSTQGLNLPWIDILDAKYASRARPRCPRCTTSDIIFYHLRANPIYEKYRKQLGKEVVP